MSKKGHKDCSNYFFKRGWLFADNFADVSLSLYGTYCIIWAKTLSRPTSMRLNPANCIFLQEAISVFQRKSNTNYSMPGKCDLHQDWLKQFNSQSLSKRSERWLAQDLPQPFRRFLNIFGSLIMGHEHKIQCLKTETKLMKKENTKFKCLFRDGNE